MDCSIAQWDDYAGEQQRIERPNGAVENIESFWTCCLNCGCKFDLMKLKDS
jgi:hypothetical protein